MVDIKNSQNQKSNFWSINGIDNSYDTIGLSSETSWRVKNRYISENVNVDIVKTLKTKEEDNVPKVENDIVVVRSNLESDLG